MWVKSRPRVTDWFDNNRARGNVRPVFGHYPCYACAAQVAGHGTLRWPMVQEIRTNPQGGLIGNLLNSNFDRHISARENETKDIL
jgi:hypothetical protein